MTLDGFIWWVCEMSHPLTGDDVAYWIIEKILIEEKPIVKRR
jgi:hypothetical protein